jgi:two-component system, OmpR family, copper resistance phosphate regulon response regulator CusR
MRLLLVEDEPRVARFMAKGLREQAYAVDIATNGDDALYKVFINDYDAVILDVMMPGRNGFEVCREIRAKGLQIPVLMLTARDSVGDRIEGLDTGADDYLTKPFEFGELLARLRALLRRGHEVRASTLAVADLLIDTRGQQVWRAGRAIALTAKEYALLEHLTRNAGRLINRAEIAEHVWDETFDPFSNLIEVYINRLRRKIDEPYGRPLIHTRRGAGYVLAALDEAHGTQTSAEENKERSSKEDKSKEEP